MIAILLASLCGVAVTFVLLVVLPEEEEFDAHSTRNVVAYKARPLPPVRIREQRRREHLRQRRMAQMS